ncbi:MAG: hypothetical protein JSV96_13705 [Candidatus Aminicenantes bacterium]|nr:MAG: hypothetical protein JSV96_13705 [Candidatus Aminicenantes bacterium]
MKRWMPLAIVIIATILLFFILQRAGLMKTISPEELKASIELTDIETKWVKKIYMPWPQQLTLVPAISFRVKNLTDKPLRYINFNAVFKLKDDYENLGDSFLSAIRGEPIMPGELSEVILLKSNYGVEGKSLNSFKNNPHWRMSFVRLFAQSKGSQHVLLGEWDISKKIDFKEPEPFPPPKKEKKPPLQQGA